MSCWSYRNISCCLTNNFVKRCTYLGALSSVLSLKIPYCFVLASCYNSSCTRAYISIAVKVSATLPYCIHSLQTTLLSISIVTSLNSCTSSYITYRRLFIAHCSTSIFAWNSICSFSFSLVTSSCAFLATITIFWPVSILISYSNRSHHSLICLFSSAFCFSAFISVTSSFLLSVYITYY